ncbi:uncharacterized protein UPF0158 [Chitinophaga dinghuensis]|uniref:Uncharacterized protein UPF0158 n=1 Tax=Chitinophaga dinghuensis TaxID=1539050 RepID=A0A327VTJ1_9BACT|nr:UPF0158 family protein [Chitinophaga dinghuensis]RAJ77370.1 uncharacterized protein UPF0158 [Chitinophaga dinghuensis]
MNKAAIYNWLIVAYSEPITNLMETFYYDRRDREFYSIHIADFLLVTDDLTRDESVRASYADDTTALIADRISRREQNDPEIVMIPALELGKRKAIMEEFISGIKDEKLFNLLQQRVKNQDGSQRFCFYFGTEATDELKDQWEKWKHTRLITIIDQFMVDNNIDLESSRVWDIGNSSWIEMDLT